MEQLQVILSGHGVTLPKEPTIHQIHNMETLVGEEIDSTLEEIGQEKEKDPQYVLDTYVPMLADQLQAMIQLHALAPKTGYLFTVKDLLADYGLWLGLISVLGPDDKEAHMGGTTPVGYLAATCENGEEVPSVEIAREFLEQFYKDPKEINVFLLEMGYLKGEVARVK